MAAGASLLGLALAGPSLPTTLPYIVLAAGDIADCRFAHSRALAEDTAQLVEAELARTPRAAVLLLGDNVYDNGTASEFANCYDPAWGAFKNRTRPVAGNHEYNTPGATGYFHYFGAAAGMGYYAVTLGSWRVISLDSNLRGEAAARQLDWLGRELHDNPATCTLAYWHHPLYSSGGHVSNPVMQEVWRLLHQAGAELVLSGHDHDYERFAPQDAGGRLDAARGIRQFVVGTGGAYTTPLRWPRPHSEVRDANRTGVLKLVLGERGYTWEFLEASYDGFPNGPDADRGAGQCHD
ncbi:MAG: metallophosphoesterase family protein [Gammaproteobacteria bacterium]